MDHVADAMVLFFRQPLDLQEEFFIGDNCRSFHLFMRDVSIYADDIIIVDEKRTTADGLRECRRPSIASGT